MGAVLSSPPPAYNQAWGRGALERGAGPAGRESIRTDRLLGHLVLECYCRRRTAEELEGPEREGQGVEDPTQNL